VSMRCLLHSFGVVNVALQLFTIAIFLIYNSVLNYGYAVTAPIL